MTTATNPAAEVEFFRSFHPSCIAGLVRGVKIALCVLVVSLYGCGVTGIPPVLEQLLEVAGQKILEETNKDLSEVPMVCEWDLFYHSCFHPDPKTQIGCWKAERDPRIQMPVACVAFCKRGWVMLCEAREL